MKYTFFSILVPLMLFAVPVTQADEVAATGQNASTFVVA